MPRPKSDTMSAAVPTSAPRSRARSASIGVTAPYPIELHQRRAVGRDREVAQAELRPGREVDVPRHSGILPAAAGNAPGPPRGCAGVRTPPC